MKIRLISCEVFTRYFCHLISSSTDIINPVFLPVKSHLHPEKMRAKIQQYIDECQGKDYDLILLGFGLCGMAADGLSTGDIPMIIPNIHDCCTMFLGSKDSFNKYFKDNPSMSWTCSAYIEHSINGSSIFYQLNEEDDELQYLYTPYEEFVKRYGEENARFLWDTLHNNENDMKDICYILCDARDDIRKLENIRQQVEEKHLKLITIKGSTKMFENLIYRKMDSKDFLFVPPKHQICYNCDFDDVMKLKQKI